MRVDLSQRVKYIGCTGTWKVKSIESLAFGIQHVQSLNTTKRSSKSLGYDTALYLLTWHYIDQSATLAGAGRQSRVGERGRCPMRRWKVVTMKRRRMESGAGVAAAHLAGGDEGRWPGGMEASRSLISLAISHIGTVLFYYSKYFL
jgi:hypothetical protein